MPQAIPSTHQPTLPTPDLSHLTIQDYESVYEPAEDSFLFLDVLESDSTYLTTQLCPRISLEIGSGSGIITTFLTKILGKSCFYMCCDVNRKALLVTRRTGEQNKIVQTGGIECISMDLLTGVLPTGKIDLLLFNPPYVVTPSSEVGMSNGIEASWAGGVDGREVIDRLLPMVADVMSDGGCFYMVVIRENRPEELMEIMNKYGFDASNVMTRSAGRERLSVLKFVKRARC